MKKENTGNQKRSASGKACQGTFSVISLGCPKNLVDTERMCGQLSELGFRLINRLDGTDFILINTCGFIADAREESIQAVREATDLKRRGLTQRVIVVG